MNMTRRTGWVLTAVLLLTAAYFAGRGPATYLVIRGWLPLSVHAAIYTPIVTTIDPPSPNRDPKTQLGRLYHRYVFWWIKLGWKHRGSPLDFDNAPF